jgi:predicted tellurium resistance membrane protein TerC
MFNSLLNLTFQFLDKRSLLRRMELFLKADTWLALLTLCFLEIVLGIDNIIFISIVSNKLPEENRKKARNFGLALAMLVRIVFLLGITWIITFTEPLFTIMKWPLVAET